MIVIPLPLLEKKTGSTGGWARIHFPVLLLPCEQACPPALPLGSLSVEQEIFTYQWVQLPKWKNCWAMAWHSCPWFWASRQMAAGQQICGDLLKWPSSPAWLAADWSPHSSQLDIRRAKLPPKCSASKTFRTCSGKNCMGRPAGCPAKP